LLPKVDGLVLRIKMFLDVKDKNYKDINVVLVTPNKNTIDNYKRFKIFKIGEKNWESIKSITTYNINFHIYNYYLFK
jgi:hypothetical protein